MNTKLIISGIGIALVAFLGVGLYNAFQLQRIQIIKTVIIKASQEDVFDMVKYLNQYPKWSPFLVQDPTQTYTVKGVDGTVGAQYHWNGNKGEDIGYQEIVKIDPYKSIVMDCTIEKPFVATPSFSYAFKSTPEGVEVTQDFVVESGLVDAFFMGLFGAKGEMEKTNQQGLDLLKKAVES